MNIPTQENPISMRFKKQLQDLQYGRSEDIFNWTTKVISSISAF